MAFDTLALSVAAVFGLPGMIFMVTNKKLVAGAAADSKIDMGPAQMAIGAYYLFLAGMMIAEVGMINLGLALTLRPSLAVCAAMAGPLTVLGYMGYGTRASNPGLCCASERPACSRPCGGQPS